MHPTNTTSKHKNATKSPFSRYAESQTSNVSESSNKTDKNYFQNMTQMNTHSNHTSQTHSTNTNQTSHINSNAYGNTYTNIYANTRMETHSNVGSSVVSKVSSTRDAKE